MTHNWWLILWTFIQELSIQRDQAMQQKAEFEKEIEKLLFDNREIKEHSRKTQRELSKEITNLTSELKDERDRIHELQKENRKLRQEVRILTTHFNPTVVIGDYVLIWFNPEIVKETEIFNNRKRFLVDSLEI